MKRSGKKSLGISALANFGMDTRNDRGDMLIGFVEKKI